MEQHRFYSFLSPRVSAGPQKPQTLTASKTKFEKFGPLKNRYFGVLIVLEREFFDP